MGTGFKIRLVYPQQEVKHFSTISGKIQPIIVFSIYFNKYISGQDPF